MSLMIFVNLPVTNLSASMALYEALGFSNNPQLTDDSCCIIKTNLLEGSQHEEIAVYVLFIKANQ